MSDAGNFARKHHLFNFRGRFPKAKLCEEARGVLNGHRSGAEMLARSVSSSHGSLHEAVEVGVDASPVEHAASVVQPDVQTVLDLMVVVGLMHGVIRRCTFNAGSTTLPNFLERIFWLNEECRHPTVVLVPHHENGFSLRPPGEVDEVA